jgi:hypothetical protein
MAFATSWSIERAVRNMTEFRTSRCNILEFSMAFAILAGPKHAVGNVFEFRTGRVRQILQNRTWRSHHLRV